MSRRARGGGAADADEAGVLTEKARAATDEMVWKWFDVLDRFYRVHFDAASARDCNAIFMSSQVVVLVMQIELLLDAVGRGWVSDDEQRYEVSLAFMNPEMAGRGLFNGRPIPYGDGPRFVDVTQSSWDDWLGALYKPDGVARKLMTRSDARRDVKALLLEAKTVVAEILDHRFGRSSGGAAVIGEFTVTALEQRAIELLGR
jgi:hypothetical protein